MVSVSVVVPTFNEMKLGWLPDILSRICTAPGVEAIVVDGGSTDGTQELVHRHPATLLLAPDSSRAQRLNLGIQNSTGEVVLLHHPRSLVEEAALEYLRYFGENVSWGGFRQAFDSAHPLLKFTSWYSNEVRAERSGILYLDHCIFANRQLLKGKTPVPEIDIFEDTALSKKLLRLAGPPQLLPFLSLTSSVRFQSNGVVKQALLNQCLKVGYKLRVSPARMNRWYEKGLSLNARALKVDQPGNPH